VGDTRRGTRARQRRAEPVGAEAHEHPLVGDAIVPRDKSADGRELGALDLEAQTERGPGRGVALRGVHFVAGPWSRKAGAAHRAPTTVPPRSHRSSSPSSQAGLASSTAPNARLYGCQPMRRAGWQTSRTMSRRKLSSTAWHVPDREIALSRRRLWKLLRAPCDPDTDRSVTERRDAPLRLCDPPGRSRVPYEKVVAALPGLQNLDARQAGRVVRERSGSVEHERDAEDG
jgi:hypothetical protein